MLNNKFVGPLILEENDLTDLSALAISKALRKREGDNINKLNLSKNTALTHKTGEYIGQALIDNPTTKLEKLNFEGVNLGDTGLLRIIEAANQCPQIEKIDVGVVTDSGLRILANKLSTNTGLRELEFRETSDHQKYWTVEARKLFTDMLKTSTNLKEIKVHF